MVEDENDNSPSFDRHIYQGSIRENSPPGTEVILGSVLKVQDPDIDDIVRLRVSQLSTKLKMHLFYRIKKNCFFFKCAHFMLSFWAREVISSDWILVVDEFT